MQLGRQAVRARDQPRRGNRNQARPGGIRDGRRGEGGRSDWAGRAVSAQELPVLVPLSRTSFPRLSAATLRMTSAVVGSNSVRSSVVRYRYAPGATLTVPGFTGPIQLDSGSLAAQAGWF